MGKEKFVSRSIQLVLLGYSSTQKDYILLNINSGAIFVSCNVSFKELIFPFQHQHSEFRNFVPSSSSVDVAFNEDLLVPSFLEQDSIVPTLAEIIHAADYVATSSNLHITARVPCAHRWMPDYVMACKSIDYSYVSMPYAYYLIRISKMHEPLTFA